jgi:hypothetical protein
MLTALQQMLVRLRKNYRDAEAIEGFRTIRTVRKSGVESTATPREKGGVEDRGWSPRSVEAEGRPSQGTP